jgi:hypothetical protein
LNRNDILLKPFHWGGCDEIHEGVLAARHPSEPTLLYSELDDARWETRKVEIFRDGKMGYASRITSSGLTGLGLEPVPPISIIASNPEFDPVEITKDEFDEVWDRALQG